MRSPRGGSRPVNTMNILLTIGIFLQLYQIYRTPTHTVAVHPNVKSSNRDAFLVDSPTSRRRTNKVYLPPPIVKEDSHDPTNAVEEYEYPNNIRPLIRSVTQKQDDGGWEEPDDSSKEQRRRERNIVLFGNPDGNPLLQPKEEMAPWDDDEENSGNPDEAPFQASKYNYSLQAVPTEWNLKTEPKPSNESNVAVIILSARSNFERRQTIRETWAQEHNNAYFVIGGPEPDNLDDKNWQNVNSTSSRLLREQEKYGDLLDTIHPDTYRGLPYKNWFAINWISRHPGMKHIQWVLKADDDVVVRLHALQHNVLRQFNPSTPLVIGRIEPSSKPHRTGKWAEDPKWTGIDGIDEYPPWAYGSTGYVMSRPVLDYVASEQSSLYYYQGEDVSLGIWLYESPLDVTWIDSPEFNLDNQVWNSHQYSAVIGHDLKTEEMRSIYEKWKDPKTLDEPLHANHTKVKGGIYYSEQRNKEDLYNYDYELQEDEDFSHYWEEYDNNNMKLLTSESSTGNVVQDGQSLTLPIVMQSR